MDINEAVLAIERFLSAYGSGGVQISSTQVRPSGDDVDVIKIWIDVGDAAVDRKWLGECEEAIRSAVPEASGFVLQIRTN